MRRAPVSVLVLDDDLRRAAATRSALEAQGLRVTVRPTSGVPDHQAYDIVLIGEGPDGAVLCAHLRRRGYLGAIIALGEDRAAGIVLLDAGADDFALAPTDADELAARARAAARRIRTRWQSLWGDVEIDHRQQTASLRNQPLALTAREYALLAALVDARGEVVSRAALLRRVWGRDGDVGSNLVEAHLSRLRDKMGRDARLVDTVRRVGYRLLR